VADILLIDDDAQVRTYLRRVLESAGHHVWEAAGGADGLRLAQGQTPDLVLCDLFMPGQDGMETIRAVRRLGLDVPIVAMSGGGIGGEVGDFLQCAKLMGAVETLQKPISVQRLLQVVEARVLQRI
jgi:sigma-B regulation protein RsbU (phosphoserine phosphatase)